MSPFGSAIAVQPLQRELQRLLDAHTLGTVLEQLCICCEIEATHGPQRVGMILRMIGGELLKLAEAAQAAAEIRDAD